MAQTLDQFIAEAPERDKKEAIAFNLMKGVAAEAYDTTWNEIERRTWWVYVWRIMPERSE